MIIKKVISEAFKGSISKMITIAKQFLKDIEKKFVKNEKADIGTLLTSLFSSRYTDKAKGKKKKRYRNCRYSTSKEITKETGYFGKY